MLWRGQQTWVKSKNQENRLFSLFLGQFYLFSRCVEAVLRDMLPQGFSIHIYLDFPIIPGLVSEIFGNSEIFLIFYGGVWLLTFSDFPQIWESKSAIVTCC